MSPWMAGAYLATVRQGIRRAKSPALLVVCALTALQLAASPARARDVLYRYTDPRGVVHFTNVQWDKHYERVRNMKDIPPLVYMQKRPLGPTKEYDPLVIRAGREVGVPPALVKAVIHAESAFDPGAVSHKGAMGLMQLMPGTAREHGVTRPFMPEQNVFGGTRYLRELRERFGTWTMALAAYNAGPEKVDKFGGVPPYRETRQYVRRVLAYYRQYHPEFAQ